VRGKIKNGTRCIIVIYIGKDKGTIHAQHRQVLIQTASNSTAQNFLTFIP